MNLLILVVDDEPDVEMLFRQHFRRDLREIVIPISTEHTLLPQHACAICRE